LRRSWYRLNQTFRRRIAQLGLTPDQFTILRWLAEHPAGVTQRDLADLMASDANTITATLSRMEEAGMVARSADLTDKRANIVTVLPAGRSLFDRARRVAADLQAEALAAIPSRSRETFLLNLERLADACDLAYHHTRQIVTDRPPKTGKRKKR
jgi:DNA-binding MarR family transcriptional regulator